MPQLQLGDVALGLVGDKDLEAVPVQVGERQLGAGVGSSRRQIARVPGGQACRSIRPVSSTISAPSRGVRSGWTAAVQAGSGTVRIAWRR